MTESRDQIDQWAHLGDEDWVAVHAPRFAAVRPAYVAYEGFLKAVLKQACAKLAPLGLVEARAKGVPSFAEKILRKRTTYTDPNDPLAPDPLVRMTDLCGGRIIAQTSEQVQAVCRFIETAFDIDWPNSEDVGSRLKPTEFGYRSVHYIVQVDPRKLAAAKITVPVPPELLEPNRLKAEIQVRTVLEHAWADMGHEMTYKTELKVPALIHRQFAALAAVLEGADREFGRLVHNLAEYRSNFGAYHSREDVLAEIQRLRIVLSCADSANLAVRIAQQALSIGQHELALEILSPYAQQDHQGVQRVEGLALIEMNADAPRSSGYLKGRRFLEAACAHREKDAETLCALAEAWASEDDAKAREIFGQAVAIDSTEPLTLCRYMEFEIARSGNDAIVQLARPMIRSAMDRCSKQIEARVNLPWAWSSLALFHLLVGHPFEALAATAQVIRLCDRPQEEGARERPCAAGRALLRLREALGRIQRIREKLQGFDWCQRAVLLGLLTRLNDPQAAEALCSQASEGQDRPPFSKDDSVILLAGACGADMQPAVDALKPLLLEACEGLSFILVSGGTTAGVCGLAGEVAQRSAGRIRACGYLPSLLPRGVQEDPRYDRRFTSSGRGFTPMDFLQAWTDITVAGIDPARVKLLCYDGGPISRADCAVALALGAKVALIEDASFAKDRRFDQGPWLDCPNLVRLPLDAMTLRAFLLVNELPAKRDEFELAARKAHEEYVKSAIPKEPSLLPWNRLPEILKISNYHQIAYAENILATAGLGVRTLSDPDAPLLDLAQAIGEEGIRRLAEMEHGRWNVERLLLGWRYSETKDVARKLSPYLVPWTHLSEEIQGYDISAIRTLPEKFRQAGLEVYELAEG